MFSVFYLLIIIIKKMIIKRILQDQVRFKFSLNFGNRRNYIHFLLEYFYLSP